MIDQRINDSLKELEQSLKNIDSARKQVEKTISSFDGLSDSTSQYVAQLNAITKNVKGLIASIEADYNQKTTSIEKDRTAIVETVNSASMQFVDATKTFADSLNKIEAKLKYSMIINVVLFVIVGLLIIFLTAR